MLLSIRTCPALLTTVQIYAYISAKSLKMLRKTAARFPFFDESLLFFSRDYSGENDRLFR